MSETITITVKDEFVDEIKVVKEFCEKYDISFSAYTTKAILAYFVSGEGSNLLETSSRRYRK